MLARETQLRMEKLFLNFNESRLRMEKMILDYGKKRPYLVPKSSLSK